VEKDEARGGGVRARVEFGHGGWRIALVALLMAIAESGDALGCNLTTRYASRHV